ncbi:hypothetical protein JW926_04585 [Candidatus Sumerlaeota bacterium]|nr:hypothetical protein [Candidatus Sumerlaeota bacterium]
MSASEKYIPVEARFASVDESNAETFVIGRDQCVKSFWDTLKSGSIRVLAERRMGKTWVLHLALARKPEWSLPLFFNAEKIDSAPQFVWELNKELHKKKLITGTWFNTVDKWFDQFRRTIQMIQGQNLGKFTIPKIDPWESLLHHTCNEFVKHAREKNPVLIIDELPYLLDKLIKSKYQSDAIQLIDNLRDIRHANPNIRMVFCGSLGLHVVLSQLKEYGYTGTPFNDMPPFDVPPLEKDQGRYLAGCLLLGEKLPLTDIDSVAIAVSEAGSYVPFYIQHIVKWMRSNSIPDKPWLPQDALSIPDIWFKSNDDPAEISYYDSRLDSYYPVDLVDKARSALNVISREKEGMTLDDIVNLARHQPKTLNCDMEQCSRVLDILHKDHYITMQNDRWRFKLDIVRKWWWNKRGKYGV